MSVYTVFEPPLRASEAAPDPERFVFVRDGFYFWAFLLTPLWILWHRLWLVFLIYVLVVASLEYAMHYAGVGTGVISLVMLLISLLAGAEAGTLWRFTLARRGWKNVGIVTGVDREDGERRFFHAWLDPASGKRAPPPAAASAASEGLARHTPPSPDVVGSFPEPGANR
jgi:hypothetical protein